MGFSLLQGVLLMYFLSHMISPGGRINQCTNLSGNPTRGNMMCMTEYLSWMLGAWSCTPDLKVHSGACHWWPPQVPPSRHPFAPVRMLWSRDWAPVNDIYRCPINGWMAVSLAGVRGCQYTLDWWSSWWPPEGVDVTSSPIIMWVKHYFLW